VLEQLAASGYFCSTAVRADPWLVPLSRLASYRELLDVALAREAAAQAQFEEAGGARVLSDAESKSAIA
jgi:hypothetical protein